jgi:hypothetical protein
LAYLAFALVVVAGSLCAYLLYAKRQLAYARAAPLAEAYLLKRAAALQLTAYRPFAPQDAPLEQEASILAPTRELLSALGFQELGRSVRLPPDGSPQSLVYWYCDQAATTCAWLSAALLPGAANRSPGTLLYSETSTGSYLLTGHGVPAQSLAIPAFLDRSIVGPDVTLPGAITAHKARLADSPSGALPLSPVRSVDDAVALVTRLRLAEIAWRRQQPAAALLDADLRTVLGRTYATTGPDITRYLSAHHREVMATA